MTKGVAITGMGIISSIGNSVEENYNSLIENKIGISRIFLQFMKMLLKWVKSKRPTMSLSVNFN